LTRSSVKPVRLDETNEGRRCDYVPMKLSVMKLFAVIRAGAVAAVVSATIFASHAADDPTAPEGEKKKFLPWEKGSLKFGGFVAAFDSTLAFGINHAAGVTFNAEELFGLDTSLTVFRAEAMYRPGKSLRHQLDFTYSAYHRDGHAMLSEDIEINGKPYEVGAKVKSVFNFDIIRGDYTYALLQDERMRIALGLGVYAVPLEYGLKIETMTGPDSVSGADTTLPLPAVALRAEFQLIPRLFLNSTLDAMYLEISDFKGSLIDVNVALEYRPWKYVGFGVGYNAMSVNVEAESDNSDYPGANFVGNVGVRFSGLMLYGKFTF
jgi:hypothetical protein